MTVWGTVVFWKRVGIVCSGITALFVCIGMVWVGATSVAAFAWAHATKPIVALVSAERIARVDADSMIVRELRDVGHNVKSIGEALRHPLYSTGRTAALDSVSAE